MRETSRIRPRFAAVVSTLGCAAVASRLFLVAPASASTGVVEPSLALVTPPTVQALSSGNFTCTIQHLAVANERRERIAGASTVEEARDLALTPVRAARRAIQLAGLVAAPSDRMIEVRAKLEGFESRIQSQETPAAVAGEFRRLLEDRMERGNLVQVADLNVGSVDVRGPGNCHYTTGEIIAIIIGFFLFIIPGIVLLIVLC